MFYADALGFLGKRGGPIVVEDGLKLNLVHLTAVPPWITTMAETLVEIEKFKKMILNQPRLRLVTNQRELASAVADGKVGVILGMQNTPHDIISIDDVRNDKRGVAKLRKAGVRIIAPCYDKQNGLGSGWFSMNLLPFLCIVIASF
jgi:microsomal dipeptidase-like Zn-dependent dipeptidase